MSIFINLVETLSDLINEESLNEKIMSKRKARRLKRKKAALEKAKQAQQNEPIEAELIDDNSSGNDDSGNTSDNDNEFKPLIVYDKKYAEAQEDKRTDYSENFKTFIGKYNTILSKYSPMWEKAEQIWNQAGKDKPCPQEAYDLYKQAIEGFQQELADLAENVFPQLSEQMYDEEVEYIEMQMTAANKFLEEYGKAIEALHPEQLELPDKLKDEVGTDVATVDKADVDINKKGHHTNVHKDNKGKDLISLEEFKKITKETKNAWKGITDAEKTLSNTGWVDFLKKYAHPLEWFNDTVWSFITSQVVNDLIKTIMYSNPITAMIYDGKILNFGVKKGLDNIRAYRDKRKQLREKKREEEQAKKNPKEFYDKRGLPKSLKNCTLEDMKVQFYGNIHFVNLTNTAYNHPDTGADDSAFIEETVKSIEDGFYNKNRETVYKNFTQLLKKLNEIADYQEWETAYDFENAIIDVRDDKTKKRKQNDLERYKNSKSKKSSAENKADKESNNAAQRLIGKIQAELENNTSEQTIIDKYTQGNYSNYSRAEIEDLIAQAKNESLVILNTELKQLLEAVRA